MTTKTITIEAHEFKLIVVALRVAACCGRPDLRSEYGGLARKLGGKVIDAIDQTVAAMDSPPAQLAPMNPLTSRKIDEPPVGPRPWAIRLMQTGHK